MDAPVGRHFQVAARQQRHKDVALQVSAGFVGKSAIHIGGVAAETTTRSQGAVDRRV